MKKLLFILFASLITLTGCTQTQPNNGNSSQQQEEHTQDAAQFKTEYEEYNGKTTSNGKEYLNIELPEVNPIVYASYEEVMDVLENGTGVIYFGYPTCPWCRNVVPVLLESAKENRVKEILYFNAKEYRDTLRLNELGEIEVVTEAKEGYAELVAALGEHASVYEGLNDDSIKRLYFPTVVFVKEGEVIAFHEGSVDSQEDPYIGLDEEQVKELKKIYKDGFIRALREVCDEKC